jgi:hypothetical protein
LGSAEDPCHTLRVSYQKLARWVDDRSWQPHQQPRHDLKDRTPTISGIPRFRGVTGRIISLARTAQLCRPPDRTYRRMIHHARAKRLPSAPSPIGRLGGADPPSETRRYLSLGHAPRVHSVSGIVRAVMVNAYRRSVRVHADAFITLVYAGFLAVPPAARAAIRTPAPSARDGWTSTVACMNPTEVQRRASCIERPLLPWSPGQHSESPALRPLRHRRQPPRTPSRSKVR